MKLCEQCGASLVIRTTRDQSRKRFCSRKCANTHAMHARIARLPTRVCRCGNTFKATGTFHRCCSPACYTTDQVDRSYKHMDGNARAYIRHLISRPTRKHLNLDVMMALLETQGGRCALSGVELTFIKRRDGVKQHTNLSIDRKDAARGYELGNIQFVCAIVNIMKSTLTTPELRAWCAKIIANAEV